MDESYTLGAVDSVVVLGSLILFIVIGVYFSIKSANKNTLKWLYRGAGPGCDNQTTSDKLTDLKNDIDKLEQYKQDLDKHTKNYLLADNKGSVIPVALSVMATYLPAAILLGAPSEYYAYGAQFFIVPLFKLFFSLINIHLYFPVYFKMQLISPYQYLEKRFSYSLRSLASFFSTMIAVFSNGVTLYVPSLALETLTGLSTEWSIIITSVVCTFYSVIGGMRAVIITDVCQAILMYASLIAIIIAASIQDGGGFYNVIKNSKKGDRLNLFIMDLDPTVRHTFWSTLIGGGLAYLSTTVSLETYVQRYMIMKTLKKAKRMIVLSTVFIAIIGTLSLYAGLAIYNTYIECDPVKSGRIKRYDEIVPLFVRDYLSFIPGAVGLFVSGIIAASLSTSSSNINSLAALITEDFMKPLYKLKHNTDYPEKKAVLFAKLCALICSILSIIIAFLLRNSLSALQLTVTFQYCIVSPLLGIFTLGMFFPCANEIGALYGFLTGTIFLASVALGGPKPPLIPLPVNTDNCILNSTISYSNSTYANFNDVEYPYMYRISYLWYPIIGIVPTVIIGLIVSLVTGYFIPDSIKKVDYELLSPPVAMYLKKKDGGVDDAWCLHGNSRTPKDEKFKSPVGLL